ncbi:MAG TPA: hypothetical protein VGI10_22735 [Polyangiaceae bacterium]|jgi:hypothetical protein
MADNPPDLARLQELSVEMHALRDAGRLSLDEWQRIVDEATEALGNQGWMLEMFANFKPES